MKKLYYLLLLSVFFTTISCFEDLDDNIKPNSASNATIQDFIYRGLNYFYLYKADTPELANDAFASEETKSAFINSYGSPEAFFDYLKSDQDRFSILVADYIELENALGGVTLNNGMEYGLVLYPDGSGNVFGYVRYILPNTDAAAVALQRGNIFNTINGEQLTETNFRSLLSPDTYTIGLATYDGTSVTPTNVTIELTKTAYTENPVYLQRTIVVNGERIGYLMYNAFTRDFDPQLNAAFAQFQSEGIQHLVLDLRYNGGGSVETAVDLSAMITGQFNNQTFYTEEWNADRQEEFSAPGLFNTEISNGDAINSLNLSQVYILTTNRTASASELVINGLTPYIDVKQVGDDTTGKFQASFLLYDAPAPIFSRSQANLTHTYAMLPLVFKTLNATGNTDFIDGLVPDISLREDFANLGILGAENEPLLAAAIAEIATTRSPNYNFSVLKEVGDSNMGNLLEGVMVVD
ncbi:MAG: C-terminal processing protease CtpA/Prc [Patiriisocius sp.]|jgi:C-terminal processing protease CtpA/Prc